LNFGPGLSVSSGNLETRTEYLIHCKYTHVALDLSTHTIYNK